MAYAQTAIGHALAATIVIIGAIVFSLLAYFGLLAWAVLVGQPLGGAFALPFMMLLALGGSSLAVIVVIFPATLISHLVRRLLRWPTLVEIPLATFISFAIMIALGTIWGLFYESLDRSIRLALIGEVLILVPLGIYWWSLQGTEMIFRLSRKLWGWVARRPQNSVTHNAG